MGQAIDNLITLERVKSDAPNLMKLQLKVGRSKLCKTGHIHLEYNPETTDFKEVTLSKIIVEPTAKKSLSFKSFS